MFKGHPKGLYVAFFSNMGERFGFYTMVAIFVMFLQAKYGLTAAAAGTIHATFLACVYFFPLFGGLLADRVLGYGRTISIGMVVMFSGYALLAIPSKLETGFGLIIVALAVIAIGTGMFKGNLQALVGNLYDDPKYSPMRDRAFTLFYMGINVGAMFAPTASKAMSNGILAKSGFFYDARIPALAHEFLKGKLADISAFLSIAQAQSPNLTADGLKVFSENYINTLSKSYHLGFGLACLSLIASMLIFWGFRKHYKQADMSELQKSKSAAHRDQMVILTPKQTKERIVALVLVFLVVIFFWMAFHQNSVTQTFFARDYTLPHVNQVTNLWFDLFGLLPIFLSIVGLVLLVRKSSSKTTKLIGGAFFIGFAGLAFLRYQGYEASNRFVPQMFQHFNPFFIVALTPIVVGFFAWLNRKGKEPSAPRKIGLGMIITAFAFGILAIGSIGLPSPKSLGGLVAPEASQVSTYWLISTYFLLTIAELFLSPIGISFVSRVAPPKYKGLMQGGWFAATAIGNYLILVMAWFWMRVPLWAVWVILIGCCLLSATFIFSIMKRLERVSKA